MSKRILFVDDEPMILEAIQHGLRCMRAEWEVKFANSGAEALEMMGQIPFDIVITDMRMPGMDGAQLLERDTLERYALFSRGNRTGRLFCARWARAISIWRNHATSMNLKKS